MALSTSEVPITGETSSAMLGRYVRELYQDVRLIPFLHRLSTISCQILDCPGGSISVVDETGRRYLKVAEFGTECKIGHTFPLNEGVTGRVFAERRPVVLESYRDIERGHMPAGSPVGDGAVAAVPMWWRGQLIGANVVFAGEARKFAAAQVDQLEMTTTAAVPGIVMASAGDPSLAHLLTKGGVGADRSGGGRRPDLPFVLRPNDIPNAGPAGPARSTRSVRSTDQASRDLTDRPAGGEMRPDGECPLSSREFEVLTMVARGQSTRSIAADLEISPKTVEKHIGSVLRKTNAENRTGAVAMAFASGWVV